MTKITKFPPGLKGLLIDDASYFYLALFETLTWQFSILNQSQMNKNTLLNYYIIIQLIF